MLKFSNSYSIFIAVKQLSAFVFLFQAVLCFSQTTTGTLKGVVTDGREKLPLASVVLLKTNFAVNADTSGHFAIGNIPPGEYQLRITYVGYENFQQAVQIQPGKTYTIKANLISLTANLQETVITGTLKEASKLESVTPVDVYTAKYFERTENSNIWDALGMVNGIFPDVDNGVSNTSDIQINGIEGNYTLTCIDGVPAMNGLAGVYAFQALPMDMIDKIEVVRGASSTLYGSDAMAGVINIITKNPSISPTFSADVNLTSMLETNANFTASAKLKKVSVLFALNAENMNTKWDINNDGFTDIPLTNRANLFNKWNFTRKDNKLATIYGRFLFDDRLGGQMSAPWRSIGSDQYYTEWVRTYQWQAGFQYQLPGKEKFMLVGDYSEHYQSSYYGTFYYAGRQKNIFAQLTWNKKIGEHHDLLIGAAYKMKYYTDNTGLSVDSLFGSKFQHIGGVFVEDEITIACLHKLIIGARFDYTSTLGPFVMPRINYKWNTEDRKNVLRLGFTTGYRVPDPINDGYGVQIGSRQVQIIGKLSAETNFTASGNYTRVQDLPGGVLSLDAGPFLTYFTSYIDPDYSQPGYVIYQNTNAGLMAPGFSVNGDFTFNFPLKIGIGVTYTDVYEINDSAGIKTKDPTPHASHFTANFYLSYNFPVPQLSIDWTGNIISPMLLVTEDNDYRPSESPWYTIQNIQITKKFKKGVELYFGIKNFFNFIQPNPIIRPFDPFNRMVNVNNPNGYVFDTEYGFITTQGISGFVGFKYKFN
jgi:outer membrane receptor for ferrienterochelin and colicins